jgi:hypothetical protein
MRVSLISTKISNLIEYSENIESRGFSHLTVTELLVTFSIVRFLGGRGSEKQTK